MFHTPAHKNVAHPAGQRLSIVDQAAQAAVSLLGRNTAVSITTAATTAAHEFGADYDRVLCRVNELMDAA